MSEKQSIVVRARKFKTNKLLSRKQFVTPQFFTPHY